jgi:hypothetical protein
MDCSTLPQHILMRQMTVASTSAIAAKTQLPLSCTVQGDLRALSDRIVHGVRILLGMCLPTA